MEKKNYKTKEIIKKENCLNIEIKKEDKKKKQTANVYLLFIY